MARVDYRPTGRAGRRGSRPQMGQPLASRAAERAAVVLDEAGGHQGDPTRRTGAADQRGGGDVRRQHATGADRLLFEPVLYAAAGQQAVGRGRAVQYKVVHGIV